jgi:hypothetical protein
MTALLTLPRTRLAVLALAVLMLLLVGSFAAQAAPTAHPTTPPVLAGFGWDDPPPTADAPGR